MKRRGSFTMTGRMVELDRHGHVDGKKEMVARLTASRTDRVVDIISYVEDGVDSAAEERKNVANQRSEKKPSGMDKARDLHMPFLASEQARYIFTFLERDPQTASHIRLGFVPRVAAEDAFKGSAWVDEVAGEVLTMGFFPCDDESANPFDASLAPIHRACEEIA